VITKERLEDLRKERKLSFKQLSELLEEEDVFISHTNLKNYEIGDEHHALYNRTKGMSLENFVALADVYDVSLDYLLGRSRSRKNESHQISEELRLSDKTIDNLKKIIDDDNENAGFVHRIKILDDFLSDFYFLSAIDLLRDACYAYDMYEIYNQDSVTEQKRIDPKLRDAETYLERYGLKAVDPVVICDLFINQAIGVLRDLIWRFPRKFYTDYQKKLRELR
jgi:transcriptional regulator with XRE-family HTH domain